MTIDVFILIFTEKIDDAIEGKKSTKRLGDYIISMYLITIVLAIMSFLLLVSDVLQSL